MVDILDVLQRWYAGRCDGEWEQRYGISIQSCDNPGWWVKIDLEGTGLQARLFPRIAENVDLAGSPQSERWLDCRVEDGVWKGAGDESKLGLILKAFLTWAEGAA